MTDNNTVDPFASAQQQAAAIRRGDVSSVQLTQLYIQRIEQYDNSINAVIVRCFDEALADAAAADRELAEGKLRGPLHGVPMTIKESYVIAGTPSTWGIEAFRDNVAHTDGLAVQRFKQAGAIFLGKTNVPVDLADLQSYNPIYGTCNNPYDQSRTPGGSSGGSAAALAAGFCALEAGSDIGGSIRTPAHFCGVFGHKPTYGIVPMSGHELVPDIPPADQAVCGPLARDADDLHLAMDILARPAPREALGWALNLPAADFSQLKDLRVAIWSNDAMAPVSAEVQQRVEAVGEILAREGATVSYDARPDFDLQFAHNNYLTLLTSVMSAAMTPDQVAAAEANAAEFSTDDPSYAAVNARAAVLSHRDWIRTNTQREKLRLAWQRFFTEWDILVCPQTATEAFPHNQSATPPTRTIQVDDQQRPYFEQLFWAGLIINSYLPSTSFPTGLSANGLPIGVQAVSAPYRDHRCIEFAKQITQHIGGFTPPPALVG